MIVVEKRISRVKAISLVAICMIVLVGLSSMFLTLTLKPVSKSNPSLHVYFTLGEGRIGYIVDTDPSSKPPVMIDNEDNFTRSIRNQLLTKPYQMYGLWGGPASPRGGRTVSAGFVIDHYSADYSMLNAARFSRDTYAIPAWVFCLPAFAWLIGPWLYRKYQSSMADIDPRRGFEVEVPLRQANIDQQNSSV